MTKLADTPARTDAQLVERARSGDRAAWDDLISRHTASVFRVALGILGDEDGAADAAQETFVRAMGAIGRFRGDASFKTWLLAIAANEAKGAVRKAKRRREAPLEAPERIASGERDASVRVQIQDEAKRVRQALAGLPPKQRMAVTLRIFEGLTFKEVAALIDSTEGAARVNYHHGIRRLREMMGC